MTQQSPVPTPHNESYTDTDGPRMNVESFNLDHTKVAAPFIRVADRKHLPGGDELVKYDVRFTQPNVDHLDMKATIQIGRASCRERV